MKLILVADIFGKTPALDKLAVELGASDIIDPYDGEFIEFTHEEEAYNYFSKNVGLDRYSAGLLSKIERSDRLCFLIGFSVGASAIWKLSQNISKNKIKKAIGYYGSQIRNFTDIVPNFDFDLIFPEQERHFDVSLLISRLSKIPNVKVSHLEYFHGFMNTYSTNYHQLAYQQQVEFLRSEFINISVKDKY